MDEKGHTCFGIGHLNIWNQFLTFLCVFPVFIFEFLHEHLFLDSYFMKNKGNCENGNEEAVHAMKDQWDGKEDQLFAFAGLDDAS